MPPSCGRWVRRPNRVTRTEAPLWASRRRNAERTDLTALWIASRSESDHRKRILLWDASLPCGLVVHVIARIAVNAVCMSPGSSPSDVHPESSTVVKPWPNRLRRTSADAASGANHRVITAWRSGVRPDARSRRRAVRPRAPGPPGWPTRLRPQHRPRCLEAVCRPRPDSRHRSQSTEVRPPPPTRPTPRRWQPSTVDRQPRARLVAGANESRRHLVLPTSRGHLRRRLRLRRGTGHGRTPILREVST